MAKRKTKKVKAVKRKAEPQDWQETHSPTVEHTARGDVRHDPKTGQPKREVIGVARRRKDDAELWMGLDPAQIQAAEELREAQMATLGGMAVKGASYEQRVDSQRGAPTGIIPAIDRTTHYLAWARACHAAVPQVDLAAVEAVICEGYGCRTVDRARHRRNGWATKQVHRGLDLWDSVRPKRRAASATELRPVHPMQSASIH